MTPNAEIIYKELLTLPAREFFATPSAERIFTNPWELLRNAEKERFIKMLSENADALYEKMSDFERFSAALSGISRAWGSGARELLVEELSLLFEYELANNIPDTAESWRDFTQKMSERDYSFNAILGNSNAELVCDTHLPIVTSENDYGAWIKRNVEAIEKASSRAVTLDISKLNFVLTDRYHAEEAYKSFCRESKDGLDIALSGLLFSIFEAARKRNICLLLNVGNNLISTRKMIDYFTERGVLTDLVLFVSADVVSASSELCGVRESGKRQCKTDVGILYEPGDTSEYIANKICNIARFYPVTRIVVGGSLTDSVTFEARHRILRRAVSIAADRICPDKNTALECAKRIIDNSARYV